MRLLVMNMHCYNKFYMQFYRVLLCVEDFTQLNILFGTLIQFCIQSLQACDFFSFKINP